MSVTLSNDVVPRGPWAALVRFIAQYPSGSRGEALHLALQALRARVEPDQVLGSLRLVKAVSRGRRAYARSGRHARRADLHLGVGSE